MNKMLSVLGLALATTLTGTVASANSGTIRFEGKITSTTCPIEVVNPGDGSTGNLVNMGSIEASRFTGIDQELSGKSFALRVNDNGGNCGLASGNPNAAKVTFTGDADTSGDYFGVTPTADGAKGVAIVIKDQTGVSIKPGDTSAPYTLVEGGVTDMVFNAYYRSTEANVEAGAASADVQFVVAIN
ncbi:fimbrial protein [Pseudomonas savastanoi pv. phaseolicola]|uniref:Type I fimbrial protein FimA n=3 Tax=Pseudomonas savastanoi TaxID=29438 RepID=A0A3M4MNU0_PSESG|nr:MULTISPECIES: fimbrial protein [Pseudomonas]AAZ35123.1 type I fimbrial protein FimA [Pseudomonas savastanoi pv. phaseolicola 1448A]KPB39928.1 Type I fimbrial protein FimA [Pseudomonas savastanoi pv. phaseolicola]KPB46960.1 Type I fimbrial protein FimA [Pseudomonas savastanoi pv. phaseolicola]KPY10338.1 Type I fimbrial protein FimA [Pseudomonas savastanoi pv. phaseolicola]MDG6382281.1 fimbrial protein [Pseudomonas savastanoi pv. phaseolicola]